MNGYSIEVDAHRINSLRREAFAAPSRARLVEFTVDLFKFRNDTWLAIGVFGCSAAGSRPLLDPGELPQQMVTAREQPRTRVA